MQKILITGASGFLGWHLCQLAQQKWEVYGAYHSHSLDSPGVKTLAVNLTNFSELKHLFNDINPTAVIHTAANSQPNYCQTYPQESHTINVTASCNIAGLCADYSIPCAFTSTDLVFDGLNPPYKETDPVSPVNTYGEQKVMAEIGMLERYPMTAVCRMPLMFGMSTPTAKSFIQPFIQILKEEKELKLFIDEFRTPVSAITAAKGILLALEKINGYIHLGGKERISRYDFGRLLVEVFQLPETGLKSCRQQDVKMAAPRPADVSLDSSKAFALGYEPLAIKSELQRINKI
ncbi:SDR family oxidoreductase [Umezakia ovalisporum]|jgi:dTDP-4-dehydrorhamnose reductase|uniref:NAD(P)-dependent oxidoreductase n=2 Tax=Umezakia ovalisporum TaxID=75695 RepID=A0AA43GZG9_9CYAN|nr:NAD(P)-dependent oxidoreductase [Umezakia ovalisporum]MBI1241131.1 sugar nucleotide-binding protein [Nostoc sp. RI_552]MDH6056504.1 NAD(P)-dependent oxidoreductase [Umezakia ovalisporum FSS-43]MDH6064022.1 NAD(P)-dependent oxidoreductase [Umezakia ovalisporum FSS-62]MDH6065744.1 NAD(P)-dependent oxidoreductase [Umezakia ovalisporum APH033B]MDH6069254.1 NAD(P)-dependent oxidoreductase [Umezakia ovalisporum CobakiLakeA]